ncbi:MAG: hypothetical protein E7351_01075 [Clostridiales bacterium]|nr:hypothetical protein [Clostridiales bacterium]
MNKNLKLSYILFLSFFAIIIAWNTLASFFRGVGVNYVALLAITLTLLILILTDSELFDRTKDLFITVVVFTALEFFIYMIFEFGIGDYKTWEVFVGFQIAFSVFAILFLGYTIFRLIMEIKDKKIRFVEFLLGSDKITYKEKKAKELTNGSLEEKPNKMPHEETEKEDTVVIVDTDSAEE